MTMIQFPHIDHSWKPELSVDQILQSQGANPALVSQRSPAVIKVTQQAVEQGQSLISPQVTGFVFSTQTSPEGCLVGDARLPFSGPLVRHLLSQAKLVAIAICTIGPALEDLVSRSLSDDPAFALALDSYGSAAIDALGDELCHLINFEAVKAGFKTTAPISPGLNGWEISQGQKAIFTLLNAEPIGVKLSASFQMIPRKSISLALGIGQHVVEGGSSCDYCSMRDNCQHRCFRHIPEGVR
jgi:hypothetical protein